MNSELNYEEWRLANSGEQGRAGDWVGTPVNCGYRIACTCDKLSTFYCKPLCAKIAETTLKFLIKLEGLENFDVRSWKKSR